MLRWIKGRYCGLHNSIGECRLLRIVFKGVFKSVQCNLIGIHTLECCHGFQCLMKYPVALIDMLNDRMRCNNPSPNAGLTMTLMLKPSSVRLHLVDFHRELFYDRIDQYDVFVYTEVSPIFNIHEKYYVTSFTKVSAIFNASFQKG